MRDQIIGIKTTSENIWWGIYGFTDKQGWEDLYLVDGAGEKVAAFCLCTRGYVIETVRDLIDSEWDTEYVTQAQVFLAKNEFNYWFVFQDKGEEDFYEVPFNAPKNKEGAKPSYIELWHSDESISANTVLTGVRDFVRKFFGIEECKIEWANIPTYNTSLAQFLKHEKLLGNNENIQIVYTPELLKDLALMWNMPESEVQKRLENAQKNS